MAFRESDALRLAFFRDEAMAVKAALTLCAALIVTVQVVWVPEHPPPDQPVKVEPASGEAVRVTEVPEL